MQNLEVVHIKKYIYDSVSADLDVKTMTFGNKVGGGGGGGGGRELRSIPLMKSITENAVYMSH